MAFFISIDACSKKYSHEEKIFKRNVKRLNQLLIEYEKIPVKEKDSGFATIVWKDKDRLNSFYKKTLYEWENIGNALADIINLKTSDKWKIDAIFCRAVMYNVLVEIDIQKTDLIKKAINSLKDYIDIANRGKLDKWTKKAMGKSTFNNYRKLFNSDISDEINISIIFQMYIGAHLMRLNEYEKAIKYYETIIKNYPVCLLAKTAKVQIKTCKNALEGKLSKDVLKLQGDVPGHP